MRRARSALSIGMIASVLGIASSLAGQPRYAPTFGPPAGNGTAYSAELPFPQVGPEPPVAEPHPLTTPTAAFEAHAPAIRPVSLYGQPADQQPLPPPAQAEPPPIPEPGVAELEVPFSDEPYELDIPPEIGRLQSVVVRPRAMAETQLITPAPELGPPFLAVVAKRKGKAEITLIGETGSRKYRFSWVPSLRDMESILLHQFPNSSLKLTQVAENIIVVEGAVDSAAEIEPILTLLDNFLSKGGTTRNPGKVINAMQVIGPMQVQLEVMIARVDRTKLRQLGFNFTQADGPWYSGSQIGNLVNTPPIRTADGTLFPFPGASIANGASTMTGASTLFLGLTQNSSSFGAYIEALEQQNAIKVLARPVLVTMSGRPAEFLNGGEQPYVTVAGVSQNPNIQFKKFGTQLNFVPIVMGQGKIRLDLAPSVSQIDQTSPSQIPGSFLPLVIKQSMHASVEMECGQTLIMGGMYQTSNEAVIKKVPCLGDLPWVGAAFRRVSHVQREQELMVLVTPRLVHPLDPHQVPTRVPGDETCAPNNHELYCQGLPEVPNCSDLPLRPQGNEFPAPLQYPQWEPASRGVPPQEALPQPRADELQPVLTHPMPPATAYQRLPPAGAERAAPWAAPPPGQFPPLGVVPVQWNAPIANPSPGQSPGRAAGR